MNSTRLLPLLAIVVLYSAFASAADIYIAQNTAGTNSGADCADAHSATWFNTAGNWANPKQAGKIGPGDTAHLCGTFTAPAGANGYLTFQASGSNGSSITLLFERGAVVTAPYWGANGAIYGSNHNYVIVDGGTNGILQATANGSGLAYQQNGAGVNLGGSSNSEVRNLTIANIYVHSSSTDYNGQDSYGVHWYIGNSVSIHNLTVHDAKWCINYGWPGSQTSSGNITIFDNTEYNCDHGIAFGDGNTGAVLQGTNLIYGNVIHDALNWDDTQDANHHDGIHVWTTHSASTVTIQVFNNYIYGDWGTHQTADIYFDGNGAPGFYGISGNIFNNLLVNTSAVNAPADAMIFVWSANIGVYNNTIAALSNPNTVAISTYSPGLIMKNNILSNMNTGLYIYAGGSAAGGLGGSDHNVFFNNASLIVNWNVATYTTLSSWQASTGNPDAHSTTGNPNLDANYFLQSGSSAIGLGTNLTSLGVSQLDTDKAGVLRPGTGAWDGGAYQYASTTKPVPPTGVIAIPK